MGTPVDFKAAIDAVEGDGLDSSIRIRLVDANGLQIQGVVSTSGEPVTTTYQFDLAADGETQTLDLLPQSQIASEDGSATWYQIDIRIGSNVASYCVQVPDSVETQDLISLIGAAAVDPADITAARLIPPGGTDGQVLAKAADTDYAVEWVTGGGGAGHDPVTIADSTSIDLTLTGQQITAAAIFGTTTGTVAQGDDSRLSDARTPTSHAASHKNGGSDEIATATAAANAIPKAGSNAKLDAGWIPDLSATYVPLTVLADIEDPTGFLNPESIDVAYSAANRTITLTGTLEYYWKGVKHTLASPWTSAAHATGDGNYYLSSTDGTTFAWSTSPWSFEHIQVARATVADSGATKFAQREPHGIMPFSTHQALHANIGTWRHSGLTLDPATYTVNTATDAATTPWFVAGVVVDEDLETTIPAWSQGTYTTVRIGAADAAVFDVAASFPFRSSGSYILVNTPSTGAEAATVNNRYVNVYQLVVPVASDADSQKYRMLMLQPQVAYTTLAAAQAEDPRGLALGSLTSLASELVFHARITYVTAAGDANTGKCRIATGGVTYLAGGRASQVSISGYTAPTAAGVSVAATPSNYTAATPDVESHLAGVDTALGSVGGGHDAVTLAGTPDYITLSGQQITRNAVDLAADVTGTLPVANGGTGRTAGVAEDVQTFTSSGTWTKPTGGQTRCEIFAVGGGGGGGGGRVSAAGAHAMGGHGGLGGAVVLLELPLSVLGETESVTIGAGGTGASAQTSDSSNGLGGTAGGNTAVGSIVAPGGNLGAIGLTTSITGRAGPVGYPSVGADHLVQAPGSAAVVPRATPFAAGLGGIGGGINTSEGMVAGSAGLAGGPSFVSGLISGGAVGTSGSAGAGQPGDPGSDASAITPLGVGAGGGGGGQSLTANSGAGGAGGFPGGGGGGSGGARNGYDSGVGGNGADGYVRIRCW